MSSNSSPDAWERLASALELPTDAFGQAAAVMDMARGVETAKDDMGYLDTAMRALRKLSVQPVDVLDRLEEEHTACRRRLALFPPSGSRRGDAYFVADMVKHAFITNGRAVTFGQSPDGEPSTPYCRAVALAFEVLGVAGTWRGPAKAAWVSSRTA